jgi:hypothetical protein
MICGRGRRAHRNPAGAAPLGADPGALLKKIRSPIETCDTATSITRFPLPAKRIAAHAGLFHGDRTHRK